MEITELKVSQIVSKIKSKELKAKEVVQVFLSNIDKLDGDIKAFLNVFYDYALKKAEKIDENPQKEGLLLGVPVAIKDNISIKGFELTAGSKILKGYIAPFSATVIEKIEKEGAIIIGKTNLDEFAMGSSTENSAFFKTRNPVNLEYVPGGSSGGSAAAVKANEVPVALGSDTGGSVRQPASFCGVVGLKPTYGRVSRYGLVAFGSSLDVIGPIGKSVEDVATTLSVISGFDIHDSTTAQVPVLNFEKYLTGDIKGKKIGVIKEIQDFKVQPEVEKAFKESLEVFNKNGAEIVEISIPHIKYALSVYYLVAPSEASANLARYDGVRYGFEGIGDNLRDIYEDTRTRGFGREVKRRILIGTFALSEGYYDQYYLKASKVRRIIFEEFKKAFEICDAILTPTSPTTAFKFGEKATPLEMYLSDVFTIPVNLSYLPAISVPFGTDEKGLPIGIQIIGKWFKEEELLNTAYVLQEEAEHV
ncbi:Asp-tRNA(Asn)/Glu-tRNA(Gln) amidotransferase subunit GatA [Caldisericum exile]|uniref:Glutamyl-tRNA(Gln) amidotransferase subunit A n=1 Tax=Caldisericum exile (strain DSM 21853 / NBRC 104410 / AZM16c01) TaxID=511051 RepID=A0A7U6GE68_CALEA|nr:Asp-tRNA(Asn)/Glu-tRNA(Gln) amidotransferase subunit GatA [Caldisericum exile]BAL80753.1 aspartyl/glutamyl-tRNA(Asn/Gln) amidotransferase subunit A [Caldisericum exile AZM16c01]